MSFGASGNTPDPYFAFSWARMAAWTAGSLDCKGKILGKNKNLKLLQLNLQKLELHFDKTVFVFINLKP